MTTQADDLARESRILWGLLGALLSATALSLTAWAHWKQPESLDWLWLEIIGAATFPGKYVVFSGLSRNSPMGPIGLAALCVGVDAIGTTVLCLFLVPLGRLPRVGPALKRMHDRAHEILSEYKRLARMAFVGVVLFVLLPLPATGALGGLFAGQIVGLSRLKSVLAVALGTGTQAGLFAALALTLGAQSEAILLNPWISIASALAMLAFLYAGFQIARKYLR